MHDEYTIKPGGCQPLVDWGTNGKPRPWRKHHIEGLMLSEIYDALALAAMPPDDQLEPAGSALGAAIDAKLGLSTTPDGIQYNAETGEIIECSTERKLPSAAAKYLDKARRLAGCAPFAEFERLPDGALHLHASSFCRVRLCPMCQWRRSLKLGAQVRQVVEAANAAHIAEYGTAWRWLMVTFTVKNVPADELGATIDRLHRAMNNLAKCKRWCGAVRGWLRATEVTHCTDKRKAAYDTYHPHIHALLCVPSSYFKRGYIKQKEWADLWAHYAGTDYTPIVDVRTIKAEDGSSVQALPAAEQAAAMGKAVAEVSKYASKPADYLVPSDPALSLRTVATLDAMLHHRRMTSWGGILKDIAKALQLDDPETGDLVHIDETASRDEVAEQAAQYVTYGWAIGARDYIKWDERSGDTPEQERRQAAADASARRTHQRQQAAADVQQELDVVDLYMQACGAWDAKARKIAKYELRTLPRWQIEQRIRDYQADFVLPDGWEVDDP